MQKLFRNILALLLFVGCAALVLVGCADEPDALSGQDADFCIRAAWQDGRNVLTATRALTATDILADGTADIAIDYADYPAVIDVHCSDGTDFTLTKGSALCSTHPEYWSYTPSVIYKDNKIKRDNLTFAATAIVDDEGGEDRLEGECGFADIHDRHLLLTLHHTKALLRFAFTLDVKYDKVRQIVVTGIRLNDAPCTLVKKVLSKDNMTFIAYAYVDPTDVTPSRTNTLECTYNVYDREATFTTTGAPGNAITDTSLEANATHLTRPSIVARNTFTLSRLEFNGSPVEHLLPGYYYDLRVTLNPDYLYVLSDHDNQHLTVK